MNSSSTRPRTAAPRRAAGRLVSTLSLVAIAAVPIGPGQARVLPAEFGGFNPSISVTPEETTLGQFTQFTISGFNMPLGPQTIRLRGTAVRTVQVNAAHPGDTTGTFGPLDLAVPPGVAACGSDVDVVSVDGTGAQSTIDVSCPVLTVTPSPVFSGGTAADLTITASGLPASRSISLAVDGQFVKFSGSGAAGTMSTAITGGALSCGAHQVTATVQPPAGPKIRVAAVAAYPLPAVSTTVNVLGCPSSSPPPQIFADPIETGIDQFTQFSVEGVNLAAGPATIKLRGVTAGTVTVASDGTFPTTDFAVPAGAAACGPDTVTIDDVTASVAQTDIAVYCPALTVTPNPVFSGGKAADLSIAGTGFPGDRDIDFTVDGQDLGTVTSDQGGAVARAVPGIALACGTHQVIATAQPQPEIGFLARAAAAATVPHDPPIPAAADVTVLGCASSPTPPRIHARPVETGLSQFTRFSVDGALLPTGPAAIRLGGRLAGPVQVGANGTFPSTGFAVPPGAARCGQDSVTIDTGGPALATASIAVYCPTVTAAPNPVVSGGGPAVLKLSGTGFPADRAIDLGFDGRARTTVTSDAQGAVHGTISGIAPVCGQHQATATARPPAVAVAVPGGVAPPPIPVAAQGFLPVTASTTVIVVGCARITANPAVIPQGTLTHVTGTGFLPRTALTLSWQSADGRAAACSPNTVSLPLLTTDAAGSIDVYCLAFSHELIGPLLLAALQNPERETVPVVVESGSMQPSNGSQLVVRR
jgi:hypothetical protein